MYVNELSNNLTLGQAAIISSTLSQMLTVLSSKCLMI